jgi:hypothetical protein
MNEDLENTPKTPRVTPSERLDELQVEITKLINEARDIVAGAIRGKPAGVFVTADAVRYCASGDAMRWRVAIIHAAVGKHQACHAAQDEDTGRLLSEMVAEVIGKYILTASAIADPAEEAING